MSKVRNEAVTRVLSYATGYVGLRSRAQRVNLFSTKYATGTAPWSGAFMQYVFHEAGITTDTDPALLDPKHALAVYTERGQTVRKDRIKPGDLILLDGSAPQETYRIMVVSETPGSTRAVRAIGGMFASPDPRGHQEPDAVVQRIVYADEILAAMRPTYARPKFLHRTAQAEKAGDGYRLRFEAVGTQKPSKSTRQVQFALHDVAGLTDATPGVWDAPTRAAYQKYARSIGEVAYTDQPSGGVLHRLAFATGGKYFTM